MPSERWISRCANIVMLILVAALVWQIRTQAATLRERNRVIVVMAQEIVDMHEIEAAAAIAAIKEDDDAE